MHARAEATRAAVDELGDLIDCRAVVRIWEAALALRADPLPHCWIHGDVQPGNVLIHESRLSGVIDFGGLAIGDPTVDLIAAWYILDAKSRPIFRQALGVDDEVWARGRAWALSVALVELSYYRDRNPAHAVKARRTIAEVLADAAR